MAGHGPSLPEPHYTGQVLKQNTRPSSGEDYVRISKLSAYLGWGRTMAYYWLSRCPDIEVIEQAGLKMVRADQLPQILLRLRKAREDSLRRY